MKYYGHYFVQILMNNNQLSKSDNYQYYDSQVINEQKLNLKIVPIRKTRRPLSSEIFSAQTVLSRLNFEAQK